MDGCFSLDNMSVEELCVRREQAEDEHRKAEINIDGCLRRLAMMK